VLAIPEVIEIRTLAGNPQRAGAVAERHLVELGTPYFGRQVICSEILYIHRILCK
jgi:hypothetical protein